MLSISISFELDDNPKVHEDEEPSGGVIVAALEDDAPAPTDDDERTLELDGFATYTLEDESNASSMLDEYSSP